MGEKMDVEKGQQAQAWGEEKQIQPTQRKASRLDGLYKFLLPIGLTLLLWQYGFLTSPQVRFASETKSKSGLPLYVLDYAPLVWLDIEEEYLPSDIYGQVENTRPEVDYNPIPDINTPLTLHNLDILNEFGDNGTNVYLTSTVDVTTSPRFLNGVAPNSSGKTENATSCAIIVNDHGSGSVDAFYMYFYAYNLGNTVLFHELGDHIGDWEHTMVRFQDGKPQAVWYSQHANGQAFTYDAVEKKGIRPISYSARGSHANYAINGTHDHTIPNLNLPAGLIQDYTSQGHLWDPTLSSYYYSYDGNTQTFSSADGESPLGAMNFKGRWGDDQYPDDDPKQKHFFGFAKFVGGPTGPFDKGLNRTNVCPLNGLRCIIRTGLVPLDSDDSE